MPWQIIDQNKITPWNEKLKSTAAEFCQYPYYISSEYSSFFSKPVFLQFIETDNPVAYCAIIEIGKWPFKFGVIDCGPILLSENINSKILLDELKIFARSRRYLYLQIRPANDSSFIELLENDSSIKKQLFFPYHQKVEYDLNIYNKPEPELLAGFKIQCRRKIVLANREPFKFKKITDVDELKVVKDLFKKVVDTKGYALLPFHVYENMFIKGNAYGLCDIYAAYLHGKMVNAVLVVKDGYSAYHYMSGLVIEGFKANESPPAKLHLFVMQDAFYNEHKQFYNMSYGGNDNLIRFKELFNPVAIRKSDYYTYVINKTMLKSFSMLSSNSAYVIRKIFRNFNNSFLNPFRNTEQH